MIKYRITIFNNYFTIKVNDSGNVLDNIKRQLTTYTWKWDRRARRNIKVRDREFFTFDKRHRAYRFPKGILRDLLLTLGNYGVRKDEIEIKDGNHDSVYYPLGLKVNKKYKLRDYQEEFVNRVADSYTKRPTSLVVAPTGSGKGLTAVGIAAKLNLKTAMIVAPRFLDKWLEDIKQYSDIEDDEICVVQGSDTIKKLMYAKSVELNINYKFYIFSTRTLSNFLTEYESNDGVWDYPMLPDQFLNHLGIGLILNDEAHLEFHAIFRCLLYFNPIHFVGLTGTMHTKDAKVAYLQHLVYPADVRMKDVVKDSKHNDIYAVSYSLENPKKVQYLKPQGYNHILFEQSVMRNSVLLKEYIEMILHYVKDGYIERREKGDKCLVFCASVDFCTLLTNRIKKLYPKLKVNRYVQGDDYENILKSDISVSTLNKSSTGIDIKGLITTIQTVSIDSPNTNQQALGRLRKIEDTETRYYYLYCKEIGKQVDYHKSRMALLKPIANSYTLMQYDHVLKVK